jgi:hypothetical protein
MNPAKEGTAGAPEEEEVNAIAEFRVEKGSDYHVKVDGTRYLS